MKRSVIGVLLCAFCALGAFLLWGPGKKALIEQKPVEQTRGGVQVKPGDADFEVVFDISRQSEPFKLSLRVGQRVFIVRETATPGRYGTLRGESRFEQTTGQPVIVRTASAKLVLSGREVIGCFEAIASGSGEIIIDWRVELSPAAPKGICISTRPEQIEVTVK